MRDGGTVILVTAIGSMAAECVIRQLRGLGKVTIIGCDLHPALWVPTSTQVDRFHTISSSRDEQAYLRSIQNICVQERVDYVIALTDPEVDLLSSHQDVLRTSTGATICISAPSAIGTTRDKLRLAEHFGNHQRIDVLPTVAAQNADAAGFALPILFKPRKGRSSQGQFLARTAADLIYAQHAFRDAMYCAQPWLQGQVFVADVVHQAATGAAVAVCREELIRTSNGAGMSVRMVADPELQALACAIARHVGAQGCVNIEFLQVDGRYLLMDFNPRFSAGVAFSVMAGYDMVRAHFDCFSDLPIAAAPRYEEKVYVRAVKEIAPAMPG